MSAAYDVGTLVAEVLSLASAQRTRGLTGEEAARLAHLAEQTEAGLPDLGETTRDLGEDAVRVARMLVRLHRQGG